MADLSTHLTQIDPAQALKEVTVNGLFDAHSPASFGGRRAEACLGLTWGYYGGRWGGAAIANGTLSLPASSTRYVCCSRQSGAISLFTAWPDAAQYARLYKLVTNASAVTDYEDHRLGPNGLQAGGIFTDLAENAPGHSGLSYAYLAGRVRSGGTVVDVAAGSVALTASQTNYVACDSAGSVTANTAGFGAASFPMAIVVTGASSITTVTDKRAFISFSAGTGPDPTGKHSVPVMAGSIRPSAAGGCAPLATVASAANQPDIVSLDFDATTQEFAQFAFAMPKSWDEGAITFRAIWSHAATTTNFGVAWQLQAVAIGDNEALAVAYGTAQVVTDTGGTTNNQYITAESAAITIAGSPAPQDVVHFRVARVPADAGDTMAIDARLHGIEVFMTTNAGNDA